MLNARAKNMIERRRIKPRAPTGAGQRGQDVVGAEEEGRPVAAPTTPLVLARKVAADAASHSAARVIVALGLTRGRKGRRAWRWFSSKVAA